MLTINDIIRVLGEVRAAEQITDAQFVELLTAFNAAVSVASVAERPAARSAPPRDSAPQAPRSESRRSASDADSLDPPPEGATGIEVLAYEGDPGAEPPLGKYAKAIPVVGYTPNPLPVKE